MISKEQLRAARALLAQTQGFVADNIGVTAKTISNIEEGTGHPDSKHAAALQGFYEARNIEFLDHNGVRQKPGGLSFYRGNAEFRQFYDDLYETAKSVGGDICLCNGSSRLVIGALGEDFVKIQQERMIRIKNNYRYRVIFSEGDDVFFGGAYCDYRWISAKFFNTTAIYLFGDKVGFATFRDNDVSVVVHEHPDIAETQRHLFDYFWLNASDIRASDVQTSEGEA